MKANELRIGNWVANIRKIYGARTIIQMRSLILLLLFSCSEKIYFDSVRMNTVGEVVEVIPERNYALIRFECTDPPYKRQPCFATIGVNLDLLDSVCVGQMIRLKNYEK